MQHRNIDLIHLVSTAQREINPTGLHPTKLGHTAFPVTLQSQKIGRTAFVFGMFRTSFLEAGDSLPECRRHEAMGPPLGENLGGLLAVGDVPSLKMLLKTGSHVAEK